MNISANFITLSSLTSGSIILVLQIDSMYPSDNAQSSQEEQNLKNILSTSSIGGLTISNAAFLTVNSADGSTYSWGQSTNNSSQNMDAQSRGFLIASIIIAFVVILSNKNDI